MHYSRMRTACSSRYPGVGVGGVCLSACWDIHTLPPKCGPGDPPWPDLSTSPLGVGLKTPPRPAARHTGIPPARHAGIPPPTPQETCCKTCWDTSCNACWDTTPVNRMTDRCKNITLPQTSFAGGNNRIHDAHPD